MTIKRNHQLDNLKGILIFLVVLGHVIEQYALNNESEILTTLYLFIYSFHMPLFAFVSGFFSKDVEKARKKAFTDILVLYILFNSIYYLTIGAIEGFSFSMVYPGWTLWYLMALFVWRVAIKDLSRIKFVLPLSFLCAILVGLLPLSSFLSLSRIVYFLPFFLLGYYCYDKHLQKAKQLNMTFAMIILTLVLGTSAYLAYIPGGFNEKLLYGSRSFSQDNIDNFNGLIFRFILIIISLASAISVIRLVPLNKNLLTKLGGATMVIYLLHIYLVKIIYKLVPTWENSPLNQVTILSASLLIILFLMHPIIQKMFNYPLNSIFKINERGYQKIVYWKNKSGLSSWKDRESLK